MTYEYGIRWADRHDSKIHRWGMTEEEAYWWMGKWIEMGGRVETFEIVRREIGPWEQVEHEQHD